MSKLVDLDLYWDDVRGDNFTTSTKAGADSAVAAGYGYVRTEAQVFPASTITTLLQAAERKTLRLFWSESRRDNFTTTQKRPDGYVYVRDEGEVYARLPRDRAFSRLRQWWNPLREDNFLSGTWQGDDEAKASGYQFAGHVGYAPSARHLTMSSTIVRKSASRYSVTVTGSGFSSLSKIRLIGIAPSETGGDGRAWTLNDLDFHPPSQPSTPNQGVAYVLPPKELFSTESGMVKETFTIDGRPGGSAPAMFLAVDMPTGAEVFVVDQPVL